MSSTLTIWIFRPSTPPAAFWASIRARAPAGPSAKVDDALPVSDEMYPILIVVGVTPTSLAVSADEVVALPLVGAVPDATVVGELPLDELLQATSAKPDTSVARTGVLHRYFTDDLPVTAENMNLVVLGTDFIRRVRAPQILRMVL
jgi:hypothetical protein